MTEEQIAKLEELERSEPPAPWAVASPDGDTQAYLCVERQTRYRADDAVEFLVAARNAVPRLLEERKRLLALAKLFSGTALRVFDESGDAGPITPSFIIEQCEKAIAYAEEAAP